MRRLERYVLCEESNLGPDNEGISRSKPISKLEFDTLMRDKCKKSKENPLYRGIRNNPKSDYLMIEPSKYTRVSEYTENWYMLALQSMPEWKKFPNLSKSIICSSSKSGASSWGNVFTVYPFDGSKLAVTPKEHFWASFRKYFTGMNEVNNLIEVFLSLINVELYKNEKDPSVLLSDLKKIDAIVDKRIAVNNSMDIINVMGFLSHDANMVIDDYVDGMIPTFMEMLSIMLQPKGFRTYMAGDELPLNKQVWTEGNCIMEAYYA